MSRTVIKVENLSKQYRLGLVGTGTISHDLNRWWYRFRGKEDPYLKIGETNNQATKGNSDYVWALNEISFGVAEGQVLGIIGKNGAGKSTLLKLLSRVTSPTSGTIKAKGRIASLLEVGTGFHPELTGRENIFLNGTILGMTKKEVNSKLEEIVNFAGIARYLDTPVKRYSSGMMVRLGFAVAAHLEPEILIVDEVLAVGDAEFQKKAIGKMQDVTKNSGRTVLFVSHNMKSIQALCDSCIVLDKGQLVINGTVDEGIDYYLNQKTTKKIFTPEKRIKYEEASINNIEIFDFSMKKLSRIQLGQGVNLRFTYANLTGLPITISIGFTTPLGDFLFGCRSDVHSIFYKKEQGIAILKIEKWPLPSGVYSYNIAILSGGAILESIKDAGYIEVEQGDYYGTGILPAEQKSKFFIDYSWG